MDQRLDSPGDPETEEKASIDPDTVSGERFNGQVLMTHWAVGISQRKKSSIPLDWTSRVRRYRVVQSRGSCGSSPCRGYSSERVSSMARSTARPSAPSHFS